MDALLEATEDVYSLTPIQKGALLHSVSSREAADLYVVQLVADLSAPVDAEAFAQAWTQAVERHPALRSAFVWEEFDDPLQIVKKEATLKVTRFDWAERSAEEVEAEFRRYLDADRQEGISLLDPPLARLALFQLAGGDVRFVFTFHTLILDGWSKGVLLKEVLEAYEPRLAGQPVSSSHEGSAYRSYVAWSQAQEHDKSESFWRHTLEGFDQPLHLAGGSNGDAGFGDTAVTLEESEVSALTSLARERRLTLNNIVQAAWGLLLGHLGDVDDVVFGAAVSGRPTDLPGADSILGLMINTVPVRVGIDSRKSAEHWLKDLQKEQNEYRNHENVPLSQIRSWSALPPSTPLFESVILFENWPHVELLSRFRNLRFEPLVRTLYPVTLCVLPQGEKLLLHIAYDQRRLGRKVASRLLDGLRSILKRLPEAGERKIADLVDGLPDRGLFPTVEAARQAAEQSEEFKPPRTETEAAVAAICAELLGLERISVEADLFTLGGHSLFAAQLSARLGELQGAELPLHAIFANATVAGIAEAVEGLRGGDAPPRSTPLPQIEPQPEESFEPFPLTGLQRAYLMGRTEDLELKAIASKVYIEVERLALDIDRFRKAWETLIARHQILRVTISEDGRHVPLTDAPGDFLSVVDLRDEPPEVQEATLERHCRTALAEAAPTDQWPLFDLRVTALANDVHRIQFCVDQIILDASSVAMLFQEVDALYRAPETIPAPPAVTFRDYVLAQQALGEQEAVVKSRDYWLERLADLPAAPQLPALSPGGAYPAFSRRTLRMNRERWASLRAKAAREGVSPSGLLAAAFAQVLTLWSRSPRFTLNVPAFNRLPLHPDVNRILGEFASFLLLEVDHSEPASFLARARRLQQQLLDDVSHSHFSGVELVRELMSQRNEGSLVTMPVVFTSILGLDYWESIELLGPLKRHMTQTAQLWLDNQVSEHDGELVVHWDVVEQVFPEGLIDQMFQAYRGSLESLADDPRCWTEPWDEAAARMLPVERTGQSAPRFAAPPSILMHELFQQQVGRRGEAPAVITSGRRWSYRELARAANFWANDLVNRGLAPGEPVAVLMRKGWEQVVAAHAVLRAGGAYVPIDADLPFKRIHGLLDQIEARFVLTQSAHVDIAASDSRYAAAVDTDTGSSDDAPSVSRAPGDTAVIIYTSGSTGTPKGVMVTHQGLVNSILRTRERFGLNAGDRVLGVTALHHDMSVFDVFGVLGTGGALVLPDADARRDPGHWAALMRKHGVTLWNSVPAMMDMLLEYAGDRRGVLPQSLRTVFLGGDWIPVTLPDRLRNLVNGVEVVSVGGPTETSLWNIWYPIGRVNPAWKSIPYGKPIGETRYYILNEQLDECPDWVPGELYCAGIGLAAGYWRDEEKTAERFIQHPRLGVRMYRTGDWGRRLPDGNIEFLGREDFQVKINGQRIELGEIENALMQHPAVKRAVVCAQDEGGKRSLAAYVVCSEGATPQAGELRDFLTDTLPEHMTPAAYTVLDALPLTRNGKVDRQALPKAKLGAAAREEPAGHPASRVDSGGPLALVQEIVSKILGAGDVDPDANLLAMGANSIDIVRIGNQLEKAFGRRPRIDQIFRMRDIREIADYYRDEPSRPTKDDNLIVMPYEQGVGIDEFRDYIQNIPLLNDLEARQAFKEQERGLRKVDPQTPTIDLVSPERDEAFLQRFRDRRSHRTFSLKLVSLRDLGGLLACLRRVELDGKPKYLYGSPGGLYPGQVYLHVKPGRVEGLAAGAYYYDPAEHRLALLTENARIDRGIHLPFINSPIFDEAAFSVFMIPDLDAIAPTYGNLGLYYCVVEAGLIAQLLELNAPEYGLGLCQIGSLDFAAIRPMFKLKKSQILVHSMLGGLPQDPGDRGAAEAPTGADAARAQRLLQKVKSLSPEEAQALLRANVERGEE